MIEYQITDCNKFNYGKKTLYKKNQDALIDANQTKTLAAVTFKWKADEDKSFTANQNNAAPKKSLNQESLKISEDTNDSIVECDHELQQSIERNKKIAKYKNIFKKSMHNKNNYSETINIFTDYEQKYFTSEDLSNKPEECNTESDITNTDASFDFQDILSCTLQYRTALQLEQSKASLQSYSEESLKVPKGTTDPIIECGHELESIERKKKIAKYKSFLLKKSTHNKNKYPEMKNIFKYYENYMSTDASDDVMSEDGSNNLTQCSGLSDIMTTNVDCNVHDNQWCISQYGFASKLEQNKAALKQSCSQESLQVCKGIADSIVKFNNELQSIESKKQIANYRNLFKKETHNKNNYPHMNNIFTDYESFISADTSKNIKSEDGTNIPSKCAMRYCQVQNCAQQTIPAGLKDEEPQHTVSKAAILKQYKEGQQEDCSKSEDFNHMLSHIDTSISAQAHKEFELWAKHDEAEEDFCISDDKKDGAEYVDLLLNPERFTGYRGESAHRIWRTIYDENCFGGSQTSSFWTSFLPHLDFYGDCLEQRAFYRLISGLHTSINIHLCSKYLLSPPKDFLDREGRWGPNLEEFKMRFSPETTNTEGPKWLRNLYFIYLVELRALAKAAPYLRREQFYTGLVEEDEEVKLAINDLLSVVESFQWHFNENALFSNGISSSKFKQEYKEKFRNISRIMDCVGCDKCKLWGKLQTQGLGTALKVLYSEKLNFATESGLFDQPLMDHDPFFKLSRSEIVSLFNAFGRLSNSIFEMENFRNMLR